MRPLRFSARTCLVLAWLISGGPIGAEPSPPASPCVIRMTEGKGDEGSSLRFDARCLPALSADATRVAVPLREVHDGDTKEFAVAFLDRSGKVQRLVKILSFGPDAAPQGRREVARRLNALNQMLDRDGLVPMTSIPLPQSYRPHRGDDGKMHGAQLTLNRPGLSLHFDGRTLVVAGDAGAPVLYQGRVPTAPRSCASSSPAYIGSLSLAAGLLVVEVSYADENTDTCWPAASGWLVVPLGEHAR